MSDLVERMQDAAYAVCDMDGVDSSVFYEGAKRIAALEADLDETHRERDKSEADLCRWRSAIQELTPGGSEFISPDAVRAWAQMQKTDCAKAKLNAASARKDAEAAERRADRLAKLLREARETIAHWGSYAGEYFQQKHNLAGDLAEIDAALADEPGEKEGE